LDVEKVAMADKTEEASHHLLSGEAFIIGYCNPRSGVWSPTYIEGSRTNRIDQSVCSEFSRINMDMFVQRLFVHRMREIDKVVQEKLGETKIESFGDTLIILDYIILRLY